MANVTLLIDGKNTAYRSVFAGRGNADLSHCHPFSVWLRFASVWFDKFKPNSVHMFWDCPTADIWRKKVLVEYKDHRQQMPAYTDEVQGQLNSLIVAAQAILPYMGIRQYVRAGQECDDLIYAACRVLMPPRSSQDKIIIISNDSDFLQLQWSMPHVMVYLPKNRKFADHPDCNPAIQKALNGDKADNIDGFRGIGPVKSRQLALNMSQLIEYLGLVDAKKFKRNLALIDLSANPAYLTNMLYIMSVLAQQVAVDPKIVNTLSLEYKVRGLNSEFSRALIALKKLS
jgi:5'-3' exonuclease